MEPLKCTGENCKCLVTREKLRELVKDELITTLNNCPSCEHKYHFHATIKPCKLLKICTKAYFK